MKKSFSKVIVMGVLTCMINTITGGMVYVQAAEPTTVSLSTTWKFAADPDQVGITQQWYSDTYDDSSWQTILSGQSWESQGVDYAGYAWYRQKIDVPASSAGAPLKLILASIYSDDDVYFNGVRIGGLKGEYKYNDKKLRTYMVPASSVRFGQSNTIAIRIWGGNIGFQGKNSGLVSGTYQAVLDKYHIMARPAGGTIDQEMPVELWDMSTAQQGTTFELVYRFDPTSLTGDPSLFTYTLKDYYGVPMKSGTANITTESDGIARAVISVDAATSRLIYLGGRFRIIWQTSESGQDDWIDTGNEMTVFQPTENYSYNMRIYKKTFAAGTISLPPDASYGMYTVIFGGDSNLSVTGLTVADIGNASDWSLQTNLQTGNTAYGDRAYTFSSVPSSLAGMQWIRSAMDSKTATQNPLVTFTINQQTDVYVAVDKRDSKLPWEKGDRIDNLCFAQRDTTPLPTLVDQTDTTPYGQLKLVDRIDCSTPESEEVHPYLQSSFLSSTQYNTPGAAVNVSVNTILGKQARESEYGWYAYRIGRGQLTPNKNYLLRIEYPEDKPRYCPIEIQSGQNYMDVGWESGVGSSTDVYAPWPLSNSWKYYDVIVQAGEEGVGAGGAGDGDGKNGMWVYFMNKNKPDYYFTMYSGGPAVATISLYEMDAGTNSPAITLPQDLPQRELVFDWERQPTQDPTALVNYAKLMGYSAISPVILKWGFTNYGEPLSGYDSANVDNANYWVTSKYVAGSGQAPAPAVPGVASVHSQYLAATKDSGIQYIPRFEYGGSYDLPTSAQSIGPDGTTAKPNRFADWGANLLNPATWTDLKTFMDSLLKPYAAGNPQLTGALWRIRSNRMQASYGPEDITMFCNETATVKPSGLTDAQLAKWASSGEVGKAYAAWWQMKRAAFHQQLVNLMKSYRPDMTLYYYNWDADKFTLMRPDLYQAAFYQRLVQIGGPAAYAEDRAARATYTANDYINVIKSGDFSGWYSWAGGPDQALNPSLYSNMPGIELFAPAERLPYADKPDYLNYFQTKDGLAVSNAVSYDENASRYINPKFEGNMITPGGAPFSMAMELLAYYNGDARTLNYTCYTYGRGFADAHRKFAQAFRALPAVQGYVVPGTPTDTMVRTYPTRNGTYVGIAYKGYSSSALTINIPGNWNQSMVVKNLVTNEIIPTVISNGNMQISLESGPMELNSFLICNSTPQAPLAPAGLTASAGNNQTMLSWIPASEATSYNVKRATTSGGPYTTVATGVTEACYTDTGLSNSTGYYYVVSAVNTVGESVNSSQTSSTPQPPPAAPNSLTATAGNEQVYLSWTASTGATGYNIKRSVTDGGPYVTVATGVTGTSYTDTGLTGDATYYYVVAAISGSGEGENSAQASIMPLPIPMAPEGVIATADIRKNQLSWSAVNGATGYNIKRAATSGGPYTTIAANVATNSYTDTGLTAGTTYYYVVFAINTYGIEGSGSAEVSATPVSSLKITLSSVAANEGYVIESKKNSGVGGTIASSCERAGDMNNGAQVKGFLSFDTSPIPDTARILSATIKLRRQTMSGTNPFDTFGPCYVDIKGGTGFNGALTLAAADYQAAADATQVAEMSNTVNNLDYSTGSINSTGISFIDKTGTTQCRIYFSLHDDGDTTSDNMSWYNSASSTVANRPVLEVTYDYGDTLTAPTGLTATAGDAQASLSWTASTGAASYNVKRGTVSGGPYTTIAASVTGTVYADTGLTNGATYYYVVSAIDANGVESSNSNEATVQMIPAAPTGLTATAGDAQASLSWTASTGAASYNVKRGTVSGGPYTTIATSVTASVYTDYGLTNGTTYYYVVSAIDANGVESSNSNEATVQMIPAAPTGLTATAGDAQASLSWTASTGAASYHVKRGTVSGGPYTTIAESVTGTVYADTGLTNGTIYYYVVSAINPSGESENSSEASAALITQTTVVLTSLASDDGYVIETGENSNIGGIISTSNIRAGDYANKTQYKGILSFDTSSIPDNATIVSATLKLRRSTVAGTNPFDTFGPCYVDIKGGNGFNDSTTLETADFQAAADATQVASLSNAANNLDWSTGALNATGLSIINKIGTTQFKVYFSLDDNNDAVSDYINWYAGDYGTAAYRPVLEVVYR